MCIGVLGLASGASAERLPRLVSYSYGSMRLVESLFVSKQLDLI